MPRVDGVAIAVGMLRLRQADGFAVLLATLSMTSGGEFLGRVRLSRTVTAFTRIAPLGAEIMG